MNENKPYIHLFSTILGYYIYDVNKNIIIKTDKKIYDYLQNFLHNQNIIYENNFEGIDTIRMMRENGYLSSKRWNEIVHPADELLEIFIFKNNIRLLGLQSFLRICKF